MKTEKNTKPLLIIKTGGTINGTESLGDFEDWIAAGMGLNGRPVRVCRVDQGEILPEPDGFSGVVVTGSPSMVTERLAWSEGTAEWLGRAVPTDIPILGICYGHQLLAHALGGLVAPDPSGREIGTVGVHLDASAGDDPLFVDFPPVFEAQATHQESVVDLPPGAVELARTAHPANHAFRVGACAWGVQFHPEFDDNVMRAYLQVRAPILRNEGLDPEVLRSEVRPTPVASSVLARFSEIVFGYSTQKPAG